MKGSISRTGASGLVLGACLTLAGCTGSGGTGEPDTATIGPVDASGLEGLAPPDDASFAPNFTFALGETYLNDPSTSDTFVARLEGFFDGVLAPLQRLQGLLPRTVSVVYDRCGAANSFHDASTDTITLCHELSEYAYERFVGLQGTIPGSNDPEGDLDLLTGQVLNAMAFILYHEIGHALDAQLDLPIAGNLESDMDAIATVIAAETGRPLYSLGGGVLLGSQPTSFLGLHGGGLDRSGDILCWTIGGSRSTESTLVEPALAAELDFDQAGRDCVAEYMDQRETVRTWVPGLARLNGEAPGLSGAGANGPSVFRLTLGDRWLNGDGSEPAVRTRVERIFADGFAVLDNAVAGLPGPVEVVYDDCEEPGSSHDMATRTITLCEEIVEAAYRLLIAGFDDPSVGERAWVQERAYELLWFALYHEVGHVIGEFGRLPAGEDVEIAADAIASVLLAESSRGFVAYYWASFLVNGPQSYFHGDTLSRAGEVICLALGGDSALRADPAVPDFLIEDYVTGDLDCVAVYADRLEEVRGWLSSSGDRTGA